MKGGNLASRQGIQACIMSMTEQQVLFYVGMKRIKYLQNAECERPLTFEEEQEIDEIRKLLFESVVRFGIQLAYKRMGKYRKDRDAFQDIQQDLAVIFYEKLPDYDPTKSTPTTYFLRYFNQVITEYILKYSQHMSQYDAHNVSIVRAAIKYFEERGIKWDEPMIVTKTGLSPKVVKNTLRLAANSVMANVDDAIDFLASIDDIGMNPMLEEDIREYAASDVYYPKRYKIRPRVYFIIIKTEAATMLDFKEKRALHSVAPGSERDKIMSPVIAHLNEELPGWYEGVIDFKRVLQVPGTGKYQYRDTHFVAQCKAMSGIDCYNRIVEHLRQRVDSRSQFPSAKGKNFKFRYLGQCK